MKIVALLFVYVASLNFAILNARRNDGVGGRGSNRDGPGNNRSGEDDMNDGARDIRHRVRQPGTHLLIIPEQPAEHRLNIFPTPSPDLATWTNHRHNHPTAVQDPDPAQPNRGRTTIVLAQVVNEHAADTHSLNGELLHNPNIELCNSTFGYVVVDLHGSDRLFACLKPTSAHSEVENRVNAGAVPEFLVHIIRRGMVPRQLEGVLTTGNAPITLYGYSGRLFMQNTNPFGHVRYIRTDHINPVNSIDADGYVYEP